MRLSYTLHNLIEHSAERKIDQNRAEAHGHEQRRLKILADSEIDEDASHNVHHDLLPGNRKQPFPKEAHLLHSPCIFGVLLKKRDLCSLLSETQVSSFHAKPEVRSAGYSTMLI